MEDYHFINRVSAYAANKRFRYNKAISKVMNAAGNEYEYKSYKSELRSLLTSPDQSTIKEIGAILRNMTNVDRMLLLKARPSLIKNCSELDTILRNYTPLDDSLLLACSQVTLLFDPDEKTCAKNVDMILHALPWIMRPTFSKLAKRVMARESENYLKIHPYAHLLAPVDVIPSTVNRLYTLWSQTNTATDSATPKHCISKRSVY